MKQKKISKTMWAILSLIIISCLLFLYPIYAKVNNLHLVDKSSNGFQIYRSGQPNALDIEVWCKLGITEVMVLSGNDAKYEKRLAHICPSLKVTHSLLQSANVPVSTSFLKSFDAWVQQAQQAGKKILFRCDCGCHRTGRLAAYYELKYMHKSIEEVKASLLRLGENMGHYTYLNQQIEALEDYVQQRPCRFTDSKDHNKYCVTNQ